jgi:hypothetical protein
VNEPTETADEARERLRAMAFDLATSGGLVEPRAFDAALDAYRDALLAAATPAGPAPAAERAAVLLEAADCAYRIARRLDDQHHDQRAQGAWDVENVLRAELRGLAGEAQQGGCGPACSEQHTYGDHCEARQDPTQDGKTLLPCNWARTQHPHAPHDWEPQPGMKPVHCTGRSTLTRPGQPDTDEETQP